MKKNNYIDQNCKQQKYIILWHFPHFHLFALEKKKSLV